MIDPYQMSKKIDLVQAPVAKSVAFPWLLVSRWLVSVVLLAGGVLHLYNVTTNWAELAGRAIIQADSHPLYFLIMALSLLAMSVLLLMRSRWVYIPVIAHIVISLRFLYLYYTNKEALFASLKYLFTPLLALQLGVLGFCLLLSLKGRLR